MHRVDAAWSRDRPNNAQETFHRGSRCDVVTATRDGAAAFSLVGRLHWTQLDGQWVLFSAQAGALLRVDALTAALCVLLEDGSACVRSLAARVAESTQTDASETLVSQVAGLLDDLQDSGLVECLDP